MRKRPPLGDAANPQHMINTCPARLHALKDGIGRAAAWRGEDSPPIAHQLHPRPHDIRLQLRARRRWVVFLDLSNFLLACPLHAVLPLRQRDNADDAHRATAAGVLVLKRAV